VQGLEGKLVVQATAGARHTVVLLDKGEVYGWGDCEQGQLGKFDK
jgi:alpha-tubulin suppressor-like RCC1 family protein